MGSSLMKFFSNTAMHKPLQEIYKDPNFEGFGKPCDSRLRTDDGAEFQVHSAVLSAKSEFFRGLFSIYDDERNYTVIHRMTSDILEAILIYLCTGRIDLNKGNMMHVLVAADFLMIESLFCQARVFLLKNNSVRNSIELLVTSYRIKDLDMINQFSRFLLLCFERAVKSSEDEAYQLPSNVLTYFLGNKSVNVSEERFVWSFIEKWVQKDADNRLPMFPELLKCLYIDEIDEELALDIISSQIIQKHVQHKDLSDSLPPKNKSRLVTLLGEDIQFLPGARLPPCLYFVTKKIPGTDSVDMFMTYDDSSDVWRNLGVLPYFPDKLFPVGHKVYIYDYGENYSGFPMWGIVIYDLLDGEYTVIDPDFSFMECVVDSSGRIYALVEESGEVLVYVDEEDEWQEISLFQPMLYIGAAISNGFLYVIGEEDARMFMQVYHPSRDEWKTALPPHIHRNFMKVVEYHGRIFVVGGWLVGTDDSNCREVEAYDPTRDEWSLYPPLPRRLRPNYKCVVVRGRMYVFDDEVTVYWDDSGEWKTAPSHQNYSFCSIEDEEVVSKIMKNRAATDWQETPLGNIFA